MDHFEVERVFEDRQHERHQFTLMIDGDTFKGDFKDGTIQWLNPHPKQVVGEREVGAVEAEVHRLLDMEGVRDITDDMEIKPMLNSQPNQRQLFKLRINDEEFKGTFRDGKIDWLHPKPRQKLNEKRVEKVEEQIHDELTSHHDD